MNPQQDPVSFIVIAESIYALWPNVLLLFGLLFVSVEADDRLRLRPIKKELKKVKSLVTVSVLELHHYSTSTLTRRYC
jgi:hypothetical protein